uniref:C2 domain-containing protein n=1 Tax=Pseudictyota dubia TaxID=2749911 RepID=A0A7R9ZHB4_9STRA|mmetsp:Transcript_7819/g.14158  ORF Transcript_7819/g.14158 Transcript_7819/m.14158 type:complete len:697 (+) Transcript_7819:991-3081(+)
MSLICGPDPTACPARPDDSFDVDLIQVHIARIGALVEDVKNAVENYNYLVSWKDPAMTSLSLIIFVLSCIHFDTEYCGSLPVLLLLLYMIYLAKVRRQGDFKQRWIRKEKDARIAAEEKMAVSYSVHRPVGCLEVSVLGGKNLYSRELGIPGSLFACVLWDPVKFVDEKTRKSIIKTDQLTRGYHEIGTTSSGGLTANPVWTEMNESDETKRLKQLLPNTDFWAPANDSEGHNELRFPILQPLLGNKTAGDFSLSPGSIIIQVRFHDVLNRLPVFDDLLGEVIVPLSRLVKEGSVEGWFRLREHGLFESSIAPTLDEGIQFYPALEWGKVDPVGSKPSDEVTEPGGENFVKNNLDTAAIEGYPEVNIRIKFQVPDLHSETSEEEKEASIVIAEEMIRSAVDTQDSKLGLIGSSISTFNTVRGIGGNVQFVQNQLGTVLDTLEQARNIFNFADPRKSALVFFGLGVIWLVLAVIPTRLLVLAGGLGQYAATFYSTFIESPNRRDAGSDISAPMHDDDEPRKPSPFATRLANFFTSLPTDEDLRRTYFWEARRVGEMERQKLAATKRKSRLRKLWRAQWFGTLEVKEQLMHANAAGRRWVWETAFALIQGHRFVWWRSEKHFDDGEAPMGNIFFAGHAGLAGLSPLDLRELTPEEIPLVICIFGRGMEGQQKITLLASSRQIKDALEDAVINVSEKND